jgi:hypothetical protein
MSADEQLDAYDVLDAYSIVEQYWPYDGPYDGRTTGQAALMIARTVRYLNNATQKRDALGFAPDGYRVISNIASAVHGLDQLVQQLGEFFDACAEDPTLYDDRRDRDGATTALGVTNVLAEAREPLAAAARLLSDAARLSGHLGHNT